MLKEIEVGKAKVQFTDSDNFEHEKVYRLILAKVSGIIPNFMGGLDTDISKIDWSTVAKQMLDDKDIERIRTVMFRTTTVDDLPMSKFENQKTIMNKYGFIMYDRILTEAVRHYLGEHWNTALENGCIPADLTGLLSKFTEKSQNALTSFGQLSKTDTADTETL